MRMAFSGMYLWNSTLLQPTLFCNLGVHDNVPLLYNNGNTEWLRNTPTFTVCRKIVELFWIFSFLFTVVFLSTEPYVKCWLNYTSDHSLNVWSLIRTKCYMIDRRTGRGQCKTRSIIKYISKLGIVNFFFYFFLSCEIPWLICKHSDQFHMTDFLNSSWC